jgi:small GTP-binding protein
MNRGKKKLVIGILAHVDAGKTTLSESMLFLSGKIRSLGRVDDRNAYLDTHELERLRKITIFSKQAVFQLGDTRITLLDTPGHVDFAAEAERTLHVLDYAVLVISGADGVQGHAKTLWKLLERYQIPAFIFINKMDQDRTDRNKLMAELKKEFAEGCIAFDQGTSPHFYEQLAMGHDSLLEAYLETGQISLAQIREAIKARKVFPCYFGSALKLQGVEAFLQGIARYTVQPTYPPEFGARVFKISRDEQGNRLTHLKLTGGSLRVKDLLTNGEWEEKVNQIRVYSGEKYELVSKIEAGSVCAVTGLTQTKPGEGLGLEKGAHRPVLEPVLSYQIRLPEGCDSRLFLPKLRLLEDEIPELSIVCDERLQEIQARIMGDVQVEIIQSLVQKRFGIEIQFDTGRILYKETIANAVEGVGHFEPLGHYAEVHLLLEPGEPGSGLEFAADCPEEVLAKNWQRLVLTHLAEKTHIGVLTGFPVTDMKITLVSGRAHLSHTEGGDFREATYRAVRQGLKEAESVLLEPYYAFQLEVPEQMVGRAMTDISNMHGSCTVAESKGGMATLVGSAPVVTMRNYHREVAAYTRGRGALFCFSAGYRQCHNAEEVIAGMGYDSERDVDNPTGSIFCSQGTGFYVSWDKVKQYMHVESCIQSKLPALSQNAPEGASVSSRTPSGRADEPADDYFAQAVFANKGKRRSWRRRSQNAKGEPEYAAFRRDRENSGFSPKRTEYLLVDGYNIIHAWPELQKLTEGNLDTARTRLLDQLCSYQAMRKCKIMVVFDAYRVPGNRESISDYHNIKVVFTKEAQTADQFIERFAHENQEKYWITVATSDSLEQIITLCAGSVLLAADNLYRELELVKQQAAEANRQGLKRSYLGDTVDPEVLEEMQSLRNDDQQGQ